MKRAVSVLSDRTKKAMAIAGLLASGRFEEAVVRIRRIARARWIRLRTAFGGSTQAPPAARPPLRARDFVPVSSPESRVQLRARLDRILPPSSASLPKVAAIVPCYNYGAVVEEAVASLLAQTYRALEIVVVDDGSTDPATLAALDRLRARSVRVISQENRGLCGARNRGTAETDSELVLFLDNDDLLEPEAIQLLVAVLLENPAAAYAYPDQRFFGDRELVWETQDFDESDLRWSNHPTVASLIRREAIEKVGGFDPHLAHGWEDWALWLDLLREGYRGVRAPAPLFRHRRHGRTMTHGAQDHAPALREILLDTRSALYEPHSLSTAKRLARPAVSVIVPFHDAHKFARETFESLDRQTLRDFETVVVNDASTHPESLELLDRLRRRPATRVIDRPHEVLAAGRNAGVSAARGEFVAFLDPDDLLASNALETLLWTALLHPGEGFVYPGVVHFGDVEGVCLDPYDAERLTRENFLTSMALMRRDLYLAVGGQDDSPSEIYEDWDFWLRLASRGIGGRLVPEPLFRYRRHTSGLSAWVGRRLSQDESRALMRSRNPAAFGDAGAPPAPTPLPAFDELAGKPSLQLARELGERIARDEPRVARESYRRPNVPDLFAPELRDHARIRILYFVPFLTTGGAERVDLDVLEGLDRRRFRVTLVVELSGGEEWAPEFEKRAEEMFRIPSLATDRSGALAFVEALIVSRDADILFNRNTSLGYEAMERIARVTSEMRFVDLLHLHHHGQDWIAGSSAYRDLLHRRFLVTEDLKRYLLEAGEPLPSRLRVVHAGVDPARFDPQRVVRGKLRALIGADSKAPVILFVGRLDGQKEPLLWVRAASTLGPIFPTARFAMIGDGPLRGEVERAAAESGLGDRLRLLGRRDDVAELLIDANLLLMTSAYEGLPLVVFEAMSLGVPVVATDAGGTRECVRPPFGRLVAPGATPGAFAEAVRSTLDAERAAPAHHERRAWVRERFDVATMRETYQRELESLGSGLDRRRRHRDFCRRLMTAPILP